MIEIENNIKAIETLCTNCKIPIKSAIALYVANLNQLKQDLSVLSQTELLEFMSNCPEKILYSSDNIYITSTKSFQIMANKDLVDYSKELVSSEQLKFLKVLDDIYPEKLQNTIMSNIAIYWSEQVLAYPHKPIGEIFAIIFIDNEKYTIFKV